MAICAAAVSFLAVMDVTVEGGHAAPLGATPAEAALYLHIPDKMIAGQTYHGVAVTDRPAPFGAISDRTVYLATGSVAVSIPATAVIPPGMNHGVFEITAVRSGPAEVHAAHAGDIGLAGGTVFSPSTGPSSLDLVMPGNVTSASDITAVVVVLDGNGYPVQAVRDTDVRMVASGMIGAPRTVPIAEGQTHAVLALQVNGSGSVTAASAGLDPDTERITYDRDAVTVHMAAVPDVVLQGGVIHYTIWMEKGGSDDGGGSPFHPPRAIRGELQTTDVDVVRLTESVPANKDASSGTVVVRDGVARGTAYAGLEPGHVALTAAIPGYGVASASVCVGAVVFGDANDDYGGGDSTLQTPENVTTRDAGIAGTGSAAAAGPAGCGGGRAETFREYAQRIVDKHARAAVSGGHPGIPQLPRELPEKPPANHIRFWVYPDVTGHAARGTVGFYHLETETAHTVTYDENGTRIDTESEYTRLIPARTDYHHVTVAAPHKDILVQPVHVAHPTRYTNAYDFPIVAGREGTYDVSVTSGGHTATGTLRVAAPYEAGYRLQLVPVPAVPGAAQPLYMASVTDDKGRIIDVRDEFGRDRMVSVAFGDGRVESAGVGASMSSPNTAVIYGTVTGETGVVATLEGSPGAAGPAYGTVTPGGVPVSVEMAVPSVVHSGEGFPVAVHTVDPFGIPVERVDTAAASAAAAATGFLYHNGTVGAVSGAGSHLVGILHSLGGGVQEEIVSFLNLMNLTADAPPRVAAGKPFEIRVESSPTASGAPLPAGESGGGSDATGAARALPRVSYEVESPWPVEQTAPGVFRVTPATQGDATIVVRGHIDGFEPGAVSVPVHSEMAVRLRVDAVSDGGGSGLEIQFSLRNGTTLVTPFEAVLRHPEHLQFGFPETLDSGYGLLDVAYGGGGGYLTDEDGDGVYDGIRVVPGGDAITVTATYERSVQVFVNGGTGGGIYPYGADVQVRAEPGHVIPYLVPERLAYWEGAPGKPPAFVMQAHRDVEVTAVYEPDYARAMYITLAGAAAAAGYVAYRRAGPRISYAVGGALDGIARAGREAAARSRKGEAGRRNDYG